MTPRRAPVRAAFLVGGLAWAVAGGAQAPPGRTVWAGVYGTGQADRGRGLYERHCSACHGDFLDGDGVDGRHLALTGRTFADNWESASVNDLFTTIARTMPRDAPGTLADASALDLVAFLLQANGFPPGTSELRPALDLAFIDIVGRDGPAPLRVGSGVRAVGCLTSAGEGAYVLTRASPLVRTKSPNASSGLDLERATATPLGDGTVGLVNLRQDLAPAAGTRVEAKGALAVMGPGGVLAVTSLQRLDDRCP